MHAYRLLLGALQLSSRWMLWLAVAALAGAAWRGVASTHARRAAGRANTVPEPLQVWDNEGGQNQMPGSPPEEADEGRRSPR